jgi:hypothetical protein
MQESGMCKSSMCTHTWRMPNGKHSAYATYVTRRRRVHQTRIKMHEHSSPPFSLRPRTVFFLVTRGVTQIAVLITDRYNERVPLLKVYNKRQVTQGARAPRPTQYTKRSIPHSTAMVSNGTHKEHSTNRDCTWELGKYGYSLWGIHQFFNIPK